MSWDFVYSLLVFIPIIVTANFTTDSSILQEHWKASPPLLLHSPYLVKFVYLLKLKDSAIASC